ncbi:membrane protein [Myxozyma melibiosi]|uniref:Membrane protein n=1 Tax=Myxozyma melibiosi TaxID=54550 RepID=A0ABR1EYU1_9ASCO
MRRPDSLTRYWANVAQSRWMSPHAFQYYCALSGILSSALFLFGFVAADFVSPIKPYWSAEEVAHHYRAHTNRIRIGASLITLSGLFYMPFCAAVSSQMRRVPNLHYVVQQLQLSAAAAGLWTFILPGIILATTSYRPERNPDITLALNDFFWICTLMPWETFMVQNFCFSYAIIIDQREKPLFPKELAVYNLIVPFFWSGSTGIHFSKYGAGAYNGAIAFWVLGITFCFQLAIDAVFLMRAIHSEPEGGEQIVDLFPNRIPGDPEAAARGSRAPGYLDQTSSNGASTAKDE